MEMTVTVEKAAVKPDYKPLARVLLEEFRAFFDNPENEKLYEEWKKQEKAQ